MIKPIGLRIEFLRKWKITYIKTNCNVEQTTSKIETETETEMETSSDISGLSQNLVDEHNKSLKRQLTFSGKFKNLQGQAIIKSYKLSKFLTRKSRNLIVDIILTELMNEASRLTNEDFQHIAEAIVKDFPTENISTYFIPAIPKKLSRVGKSIISRGKLVDKYRNRLRDLKRIDADNLSLISQSCSQSTEYLSSDEESTPEAEEWLRAHSTPWELVLNKWKQTVEHRQKILKANRKLTLGEIFERWPILKHSNAYKLIAEDFNFLRLSAEKLTFDNWNKFFTNILKIRPAKKDDDNARSLLEVLELEDLTEKIIKFIFLYLYLFVYYFNFIIYFIFYHR
ncbi:hypothetical protein PUN28_009834 [Cardiocondyla obscurior]|uniref:Uncharacterized protein n=1 Tax=Cardiocondyla obscurior TaxID=286306 RepID=A0AAW2FN26_9HYME